MPFDLPQAEHVVYDHQYLAQVLCQVKVNPILKASAEEPVAFQERIRGVYPLFESGVDSPAQVAIPSQAEGARLVLGSGPQPQRWVFKSADGVWSVVLTRDFLALKTTNYLSFRDFAAKLASVVEAFDDVYSPGACTRLGLRYTNVFPLELGEPSSYLKPALLGLRASNLAPFVRVTQAQYVLSDTDHQIGIRIGRPDPLGPGFMLDIDHFTEVGLPVGAVPDRLTEFHDVNFRFFRWAITDELHAKMGPQHA